MLKILVFIFALFQSIINELLKHKCEYMNNKQNNKNKILDDVISEMRDKSMLKIAGRTSIERNYVSQEQVDDWVDHIESNYKNFEEIIKKIGFHVKDMRAKLYGIAEGIRVIVARHDANERGVSCSVLRDIAEQLESIANDEMEL